MKINVSHPDFKCASDFQFLFESALDCHSLIRQGKIYTEQAKTNKQNNNTLDVSFIMKFVDIDSSNKQEILHIFT